MQIDKNIPVPPRVASGNAREWGYGWKKMDVGDSVFFADQPKGTNSAPATSARVYGHRYDMKFTARAQNGGVRIWRVE